MLGAGCCAVRSSCAVGSTSLLTTVYLRPLMELDDHAMSVPGSTAQPLPTPSTLVGGYGMGRKSSTCVPLNTGPVTPRSTTTRVCVTRDSAVCSPGALGPSPGPRVMTCCRSRPHVGAVGELARG